MEHASLLESHMIHIPLSVAAFHPSGSSTNELRGMGHGPMDHTSYGVSGADHTSTDTSSDMRPNKYRRCEHFKKSFTKNSLLVTM